MLMRAQYYFVTSLPVLPTLGEPAPMSLQAFFDRACDEDEVREVVEAVLLEHDLLLRQSVLAGETEDVDPVVLTVSQAKGEEPLPEYLQAEQTDQPRPIGDDATWEAYFRHVADVAARSGCEFLRTWVGFEVALRNDLVAARAKTLDLIPDDYYVAADLADDAADTGAIVAAWAAAGDPLAAQKALDQGRSEWLDGARAWYSFRIDEAAAYARGLVLLTRWATLTEQ